ncbi:hypothetical protein DL240_01595 [Lujinxingia litoralis]|uniref:Response regulator n=1 Tax=Lujinxingia litoralis TaxID=2211119 RepID=A0A328CDC3_9DELT|nr:HD domain-containing phosphohydrolase [Lujinxingia litoralis]RAL24929.1 hypothetical protein DL240_01595 [Lujinxingia litoralis]
MVRDEVPSGEIRPVRVLVIDDETTIRDVLVDFLGMEGYDVLAIPTAEEGIEALKTHRVDVALIDLQMPGMNGIELMEYVCTHHPRVLPLMMTGYGTVETAIAAMKVGAYDYLLKPFKVDEVIRVIERGLEKKRLERENVRLKELVDLYDATERLSTSLARDHVDDLLVATVGQQAEADVVGFWRQIAGEAPRLELAARWEEPDIPMAGRAFLEGIDLRELSSCAQDKVARVLGPEAMATMGMGYDSAPVSLFCAPLWTKDQLLGVVVAARFSPRPAFRESKRKLLAIMIGRAAAAMDNARLYGDLQQTFKQTIQALANILEDRDPYTRGHSERVSRYARQIAEGMNLSDDAIERVADSALMHDIGKLGIRFEELNKADPLTDSEFEMFKSHTTRGKWILQPITFLHPLIPGVYHHHERWDGRGYPVGLRGEDIPLMARILAVADTYDAMTSHRAYRRALPHDVAMQELESCAGTQFDPAIVEVFVRVMSRQRRDQRSKAERWRALTDADIHPRPGD